MPSLSINWRLRLKHLWNVQIKYYINVLGVSQKFLSCLQGKILAGDLETNITSQKFDEMT